MEGGENMAEKKTKSLKSTCIKTAEKEENKSNKIKTRLIALFYYLYSL